MKVFLAMVMGFGLLMSPFSAFASDNCELGLGLFITIVWVASYTAWTTSLA